MRERRLGRHWVRFAQFSPLIVIALIALLVVSVPQAMWSMTPDLATLWGDNMTPRVLRQLAVQGTLAHALAAANLYDSESPTTTSLDAAEDDSWQSFVDKQGSYVSTSGVRGLPLPTDDLVFAEIRAWEQQHDATVWAWLAQPGPAPARVASATADPAALAEVALQASERTSDPARPLLGEARLDDYLINIGQGTGALGALPPLNPQLYSVGGGSGVGVDNTEVMSTGMSSHGQVYIATVAYTDHPTNEQSGGTVPNAITQADPTAPGFPALVARTARARKMDIWVFGPMRSRLTPIRMPSTTTIENAQAVGAAISPGMTDSVFSLGPLTKEAARLTGAVYGSVNSKSMWTSTGDSGDWSYSSSQIAPQTIVYLAAFRTVPGGTPSPLRAAWSAWSTLLAGYYPWLLGGLVALLGVALVASPAAFVYERRIRARERVREEMARMQRDAHDKVYNRLSALSKRVTGARAEAHDDLARSLGSIAEDIRGTVGELQDILGEEGTHTDSALATIPLADQIAAVCRAQAARLGVDVDFDAEDDLPELPARVGWDLQCIAEEAITNAVRHAHAPRVTVALRWEGDSVTMAIADRGMGRPAGIAIDELPESSHGLRSARARVAEQSGTLDIDSSASGTTLIVRVPAHRA